MENKQKNNNTKNNYLRTFIVTISMLLLLVFLFWYVMGSSSGKEIDYSTYIQNVNAGEVATVEFGAEKINITYKNGNKAWFYKNDLSEQAYAIADTRYNTNHDIRIVTHSSTTFSVLNLLYPLLLISLVIFSVIYFTKQIKGANNKSFDFVKNRARVSNSKVKFSDVAGAKEEKEEVKEIIDFLRNPQKFSEAGARVPKGVLLVGPPGTGKTLLAKAIAGEAEVPFFTISGSDFMELFVGVGASRVRDLFETAKKAKPCIIFIDEIDAIGRQRGTGMGGGNDEREQTLNQLLVQMDGFEINEGIIVIAATNRVDILDPALLRPGRFDRRINIHTPDVKAREEILEVHSRNKQFDNSVNLKQIARITSGFTGADLENLLNESAIMAVRNGRIKISMNDIAEGLDKVIMGPQKKSWILTDRDKEITAFHESGHAIIGKLTENGDPIHEVSIIPRGGAAGYTITMPENDDNHMSKSKLKDMICMMLGGRISEEIFLKDICTGASNDLERATNVARKMVTEWGMSPEIGYVNMGSSEELFLGRDYQSRNNYSESKANLIDNEIKRIIDECANNARKILKENSSIVKNMVKVLLKKDTIYTDEIERLLAGESAEDVIAYIDAKSKEENTSRIIIGKERNEKDSKEIEDAKNEKYNKILEEIGGGNKSKSEEKLTENKTNKDNKKVTNIDKKETSNKSTTVKKSTTTKNTKTKKDSN